MEGRMSRESMMRDAERDSQPSENQSNSYSPSGTVDYGNYSSYRRNYSRNAGAAHRTSYRHGRNSKREVIPEGKDLFIVQLFASGVLLLFVMFVSIVDVPQTAFIKEKLKTALSQHTSYEEVVAGVGTIRNKFVGIDNSVIDIFGGEINKTGVDSGDSSPNDNISAINSNSEEVTVDPEVLKQINEEANEYPKN